MNNFISTLPKRLNILRSPTLRFILKRIFFSGIAFFIALTLVFVIYRVIVGDPVSVFAPTGRQGITEVQRQAIMEKFGLDKSIPEQYLLYLVAIFQGDFGYSYQFGEPVINLILERLPWTLLLIGTSTILSTVLGVLIGAFIGWRRSSRLDTSFVSLSLIFSAIPLFFVGMVFISIFGYQAEKNGWKLPIPLVGFLLILSILYLLNRRRQGRPINEMMRTNRNAVIISCVLIIIVMILSVFLYLTSDGTVHLWFPTSGSRIPGIEEKGQLATIQNIIHHAILPITVLTLFGILSYGWFMRGNIIGVLTEDYVQTAISKGLNENQVLYGHCVRNAILPVITDIGMSFGTIIGGSILIEQIFAYPGTGLLIYNALLNHDYNVVQGAFIIITGLTLIGLLIAEILYGIIDPRVRTE
ncbi:MAG: ABC transporter permease [Candidatus Hodarchaeales archaeon]|jgi:peptide/nickel transport system permease protein